MYFETIHLYTIILHTYLRLSVSMNDQYGTRLLFTSNNIFKYCINYANSFILIFVSLSF